MSMGNTVRLIAIGDIHGSLDCLIDLHNKLDNLSKSQPKLDTYFIYLGDYIDKGPHSREVIEELIQFSKDHHCIHLMGNHEYLINQIMESGNGFSEWLRWGGISTLKSYGLSPEVIGNCSNKDEIRKHLKQAMGKEHALFVRQLLPYYHHGEFIFVHAGIRPELPLHKQSLEDLVFIGDDFLNHDFTGHQTIVHGHHILNPEPQISQNKIAIDTNAYQSGKLTAAIIEDNEIRFIQSNE